MGGYLDCEGKISSFTSGLAFNAPSGGMHLGGDLQMGGSTSRFALNAPTAGGVASIIRNVTGEAVTQIYKTAGGDTYAQFQDPNGLGVALFMFAGVGAQPGGGSWANSSDRRLKKNIEPLTGALDHLLQLRSVTYEYIAPAAIHELPGRQTGFIAQEVEPIFPNWVGEKPDGMKFVAVKGFESLTVQALRELRSEKDAEIAALQARLSKLEAALHERATQPATAALSSGLRTASLKRK
jgi:hypothetical protein